MSVKEYINLYFKKGPLGELPEWDSDKSSRLILKARKYSAKEKLSGTYLDMNLDIKFRLTLAPDNKPIPEEMCLMVHSPHGHIIQNMFFPDDGEITLEFTDFDITNLSPGEVVAYAYPLYSMHPKLKGE